MKTLIVYYSFSGNNRFLAEKLRKQLHCDLLEIKEVSKRTNFTILLDIIFSRSSKIKAHDKDLTKYEHIIFIAPVWAGKIATPLKTFIKKEQKKIRDYSLISLCVGVPEQKEKLKVALKHLVGRFPIEIEELRINDLLTTDEKNKIKNSTSYRVKQEDFDVFEPKIKNFLKNAIRPAPAFAKNVTKEISGSVR